MTLWFSASMEGVGQETSIVVADIESRRPLRDATVYLDTGESVTTNWTGRFVYTNRRFRSATVARPGYLSRVMTCEEMRCDTIFLLPLGNELAEVVVMGHRTKKHYYSPMSKTDAQLMQSVPQGFNILGLIAQGLGSLFKGNSESQKERTRRMVERY